MFNAGATLLLLFNARPTAVDLFEAVVAYLKADPMLAGLAPGGVWGDEAPQGAALPDLVLSEPDGSTDNESALHPSSIERVRLQLSIFGPKAQARAVRRYADSALQDAALTFTAGTLMFLRSSDRTSMNDPERGPGGVDLWQEVQFFTALIGHGS